jgi:hypothetical protein
MEVHSDNTEAMPLKELTSSISQEEGTYHTAGPHRGAPGLVRRWEGMVENQKSGFLPSAWGNSGGL